MTITGMFLLVMVIVAAIYDAYALATGGIKKTESWTLRDYFARCPFLIFACGYCFGHFLSGMVAQ